MQLRETLNSLLQEWSANWETICEDRVAQALAEQEAITDVTAKETHETRMTEITKLQEELVNTKRMLKVNCELHFHLKCL